VLEKRLEYSPACRKITAFDKHGSRQINGNVIERNSIEDELFNRFMGEYRWVKD
jgi:hypothetical protein